MLVATSVARDTRVLREAESLVGAGYEVLIIGRDIPAQFQAKQGITLYSASSGQGLRPAAMGSLTSKPLAAHLRIARWFLLPEHRARSFSVWRRAAYEVAAPLEFDAVHAHDFTALPLGAQLSKERALPLIYDTHEWWLGRQRQYRATPFIDRKEAAQEKQLAGGKTEVIAVGDSIADLLRSKRGFKNVSVVRNSFPASLQTHGKVTSPPQGIIYAGRIDAYRELEVIMGVAGKISESIIWMGEDENQWAAKHLPQARKMGIEILPSQSISDVTAAMQRAGLAFVTHSNLFESHRLAMPNKLFHAVHAGVPIIATEVTELARIVRRYDIGELYKPGDVQSMQAAIARARARHQELIANVGRAQEELSWESDEEILLELYRRAMEDVN